jgi:hypothetical protein
MDVCMHDFARLRLLLASLITVKLLPGELLRCAPASIFCLLVVSVFSLLVLQCYHMLHMCRHCQASYADIIILNS